MVTKNNSNSLPICSLSDEELVASFQNLVSSELEQLVIQLEHIAELDRRKLFEHYSSLRSYLVGVFHMEEHTAERKIRAARLLRSFPGLKKELESGSLNLSLLEIAMGYAHREKLEDSEVEEVFDSMRGLSCQAARKELATKYPDSVELPKDKIRPISATHYELKIVVHEDVLEMLKEIRGLMAHSHSGIQMGELIGLLATDWRMRHHPEEKARRAWERASQKAEKKTEKETDQKTEKKQNKKTNPMKSPSKPVETPTSKRQLKDQTEIQTAIQPRIEPRIQKEEKRRPSQSLIHELTTKEGYRCSYQDSKTGQRCSSQWGLEIHHYEEWSVGGKTEIGNMGYVCMHHHARLSFLKFGEKSQYFSPKRE